MRFHFLTAALAGTATMALCAGGFAQTYGTKGYAPGAWHPDELPKELAAPKPYNPHDLSGLRR